MSSGLYPSDIIVERYLSSVSAENLPQLFVAPCDVEVLGMLLTVNTAPGSSDGLTVNVTDFPTSQQGGALSSVGAYSLWTATNVPTVSGTSKNSFTTTNSTTVIKNAPYALNYPLPGPTGTTGYETAQATSQVTQTPVITPPVAYEFSLVAPTAPDNTYVDYNGNTVPASIVHAGDVLTFVVAAAGSGLGSSAGLEIMLFLAKR